MSIICYFSGIRSDPGSGTVSDVYSNNSSDIRSGIFFDILYDVFPFSLYVAVRRFLKQRQRIVAAFAFFWVDPRKSRGEA